MLDNFDIDGDSILSASEINAVTSVDGIFTGNTTIKRFLELKYFTNVTKIEDNCFKGCTALNYIHPPTGITSYGVSSFEGCTNLRDISTYRLTAIPDRCFYNCRKLDNLSLSSTILSIGAYSFAYCSGLTRVQLPTNPPIIESNSFYQLPSTTDIVINSSGDLQAYKTSPYWTQYANRIRQLS